MNDAQRVGYEGDLIPTGDLVQNLGDVLAVSSAGSFLPRVQLYGGNSDACKEQKISIGHYGLVRDKDRIEDLTDELEVLVIAGRAKAMEIDSVSGTIITNYDKNSEEFQRIAQESEVQDSGCMFGPEFLIWVPEAQTFATFYMSSKTARREAGPMAARIGKAARLKSKLITGKKYKWHGPVVEAVTQPTFELPSIEEVQKQAKAFLNPQSSQVERDQDTSGGRER